MIQPLERRSPNDSEHAPEHPAPSGDPVSVLTSAGYDCGIYHAAVNERDRYLMRPWGARRVLTAVLHLPVDGENLAGELDEALDACVSDHKVGLELAEQIQHYLTKTRYRNYPSSYTRLILQQVNVTSSMLACRRQSFLILPAWCRF